MSREIEARPHREVEVRLGPRSYRIAIGSRRAREFGAFARDSLERTWAGRGCRRALVIADEHTARVADALLDSLAAVGIEGLRHTVAPGEASKSLAMANGIWSALADAKADRHTAIVAVGGGVVGDLAGFAAATFARGLPLVMVPTTLLAMVDSAVGGKVGINLPQVKNIVGAFHQPCSVWIDTDVLETLPAREFRCGMAEVVKYGVILDGEFFGGLERDIDQILAHEPGVLTDLIGHCCALKADIVARDEREEHDHRIVLNFGHTIGHAIEAVAGYGARFQHGEAVAIGMVLESRLAERLGWIDAAVTERLIALLARIGLPTGLDSPDCAALIEAMGRDKKNLAGAIRFVLPRRIGRVEPTTAPSQEMIRDVLTGA